MRSLQTHWLETEIPYTGKELRNHWIYESSGLLGDALLAFVGSAEVPIGSMVDAEDVKNKAPIYSPKMLHFLGEFFIESLDLGVLYQHFFMALVYERLLERNISGLSRRTNDLFYQGRKLSVSIASKSPISVLIHAGINIETEGTPIPTSGLSELHVDARTFAQDLLESFQMEYRNWQRARCKVYPAGGGMQ